jgi:cytochrome b561
VAQPATPTAIAMMHSARIVQAARIGISFDSMQVRNTIARWGSVAQFLHWLIVALIITQVILALRAEELHGMAKLAMLARHKSVGITILMLAVVRLVWRLINPTPPLPLTLKPYERFLANVTHAALYLLIFALPITGWIMSSARGFPVSWFNQFQLPDLVTKNRQLYETMLDTHEALAWTLGAVALLHLVAALKHHFVLKDTVLRRMLPFSKIP